ncbi:Abi family protein [Blautia wexlerae]
MFRVFPQSLKSKVSKNFEPLNQHQMEQFLSVLTKYRNVCAHGERLFTYRTVISTKKENKICLLW